MRAIVQWWPILATLNLVLLAQPLILRDGNVIDVRTGAVSRQSILIRDGVIEALGPDVARSEEASSIDASDLWVVPGLIEMHSHTVDRPTLQRALSLGITSALTVYTGPEPAPALEGWANLPTTPSPRVHLIEGRFTAEFPGDLIPGVPRFPAPSDPAQAAEALQVMAESGARRVKIWMDNNRLWSGDLKPMPVFSKDVFGALVRGARARGLKVYVHAWSYDLYRMALALDPNWIIHPVMNREITRSDLEAMRSRGLGWTSTMSLVLAFGRPDQFARRVLDDPRLRQRLSTEESSHLEASTKAATFPVHEIFPVLARRADQYLETIGKNSVLVAEAGLTLTVGSDQPAGYGTQIEIELLRDAGLKPLTILKAATLGGAKALDIADSFGTVERGKVADLVLLEANPLDEITHLRSVRAVVKGGKVWWVKDLLEGH